MSSVLFVRVVALTFSGVSGVPLRGCPKLSLCCLCPVLSSSSVDRVYDVSVGCEDGGSKN